MKNGERKNGERGKIANGFFRSCKLRNITLSCFWCPAAESYAEALTSQPAMLIKAWRISEAAMRFEKQVKSLHSGQAVVEGLARPNDIKPTIMDRLGFYQQSTFLLQCNHLLRRQLKIYSRNPIMSFSRLLGAVIVGLFLGGAFFNLPRTVAGYDARAAEAFGFLFVLPGFGSAAIAYWVEKRKQYYHEQSAGYCSRLSHLLVTFFVEWIWLSAIMVSERSEKCKV